MLRAILGPASRSMGTGLAGQSSFRRLPLTLESLEDRLLLSNDSSIMARYESALAQPGEVNHVAFRFTPADFESDGRISIAFEMRARSSFLNPARLQFSDSTAGQRILVRRSDMGSDLSSYLLARGRPGTIKLILWDAAAATGQYEIDVLLAGDVNGDFRVDRDDIASIRAARHTIRSDPEYDPVADLDRNGIVDHRDLKLARENLHVETTIRPLYVAAQGQPCTNGCGADGSHEIIGVTSPNATIQLDQGGDHVIDETQDAEADGRFRSTVRIVQDDTPVIVTATDRIGQFTTTTLILDPLPIGQPPALRLLRNPDGITVGTNIAYTGFVDNELSSISSLKSRVDGGPSHDWSVEFAPPANGQLVPGVYEGATRFPFQAATEPGLSFSGDGRGCNQLTGWFEIIEAEFAGPGEVRRFAADFEQRCEGFMPPLVGHIRFSSDQANFQFTTALPLDGSADGSHTVQVRATSTSGNNSTVETSFVLDTSNRTILSYSSQVGDYIGQGETHALTTRDGTFDATAGDSNNSVNVHFDSPSAWWNLNLVAPGGSALVPGVYEHATRFPFQATDEPGLDFSGSGSGCNQLTGRFEVIQANYGGNGAVQGFEAFFEQHCEGAGPALFGFVRFGTVV